MLDKIYQYDFYIQYKQGAKRWIEDGLEAFNLYPENLSIINQIAYCYYFLDDYYKALDFVLKAHKLSSESKNKNDYYYTLKLTGDIYRKLGIVQSSLSYYLDALKTLGDEDQDRKKCDILIHMSKVCLMARTIDLGIDYVEEALLISEEIQDIQLYGESNLILCSIYIYRNLYDKALKFGLKALEVSKPLKDSKLLFLTYLEIAKIYINQKDFSLSQNFYEKALMLSKETRDNLGIIKSNYLQARLYKLQGNKEKALFTLEESIQLSRQMNIQTYKMELYYLLSELYAESGEFELAYNAYKTASELKDHRTSNQNKDNIYRLQNQYNLFLKEKQLKEEL